MARVHCLVVVPFIFLCTFVFKVHSLSFTLSAGTKKCLREEVHKDVLVTGEFRLSEAPIKTHLTVSLGHRIKYLARLENLLVKI